MEEEAVAQHVIDAKAMPQKDLLTKYRLEAMEHRRILFERGSGMSASWQNFRQFLSDMGPTPSPNHIVTRLAAGDLTYAPGKVTWMHRDRQPVPHDPLANLASRPQSSMGQWAQVRGKPVEYADLAKHLGVPFEVMTVALRNNASAEEMVQQASIAETLVRSDPAHWLAPERRDAFFKAYRMWHMQVQPRYAAAATPAFLYLYSALPSMVKARDTLIGLELWNPPTDKGKIERGEHPMWRKFCDVMVRVEAARTEFEIYKQYNLFTQINELWQRVLQTEVRFRTGPQSRTQQAA
jgi:hypothetical protein